MDNCLKIGLTARISAPELYPVSVGGAMIHQRGGDDCIIGGTMFLNAGIGVSALQCAEDRSVLPCRVEVAWFSFTEKRAFYAEFEVDDRYVSKVVKEGFELVNGLRGCYTYFDIALFPAGRVAFYLSGDERMTLVGLHRAKETDLPVSVFAPDAGFEDYDEFAEAFISGDESIDDSFENGFEDGSECDDFRQENFEPEDFEPGDFADDDMWRDDMVEKNRADVAKAPWIVNLTENGVDYAMIERLFERHSYEMIVEGVSAGNMAEPVFSVEFANGEFCKFKGDKMPYGNYGIVKSVSLEHESDGGTVLYDIYFDLSELAEAFRTSTCNSSFVGKSGDNNIADNSRADKQQNRLILNFDDIGYTVSVKFAYMNGCRIIEKIRYRVAEYNGRRTALKGGNFDIG